MTTTGGRVRPDLQPSTSQRSTGGATRLSASVGTAALLVALAGCARPDVPFPPPVPPSPSAVEMSVALYHCGFEPISYAGASWEASPEAFDDTNKPSSWRGHGTLTEVGPDRLLYRDDSGIEVTFRPDAEVPPPGVCA